MSSVCVTSIRDRAARGPRCPALRAVPVVPSEPSEPSGWRPSALRALAEPSTPGAARMSKVGAGQPDF